MQLTYSDLAEVTKLQMRLLAIAQETIILKETMQQLAEDDCSIDMLMRVHNETHCAEGSRPQIVKTLMDMPYRGAVNNYELHAACKRQLQFSLEPRSAIRLLNMLFLEKENEALSLQSLIQDIYSKYIPSPTQFLYHDSVSSPITR